MEQGNNRTIAKNTAFLYFRMMFTMIVSLYTSRVILQTLGVDDYGIYQSVGGIVGFLAFINSALSTGRTTVTTTTNIAKKGWTVGDDITALTKAGNTPSWSTVRQRFWKNEAMLHPDAFDGQINRMQKGLAPIGPDGFSVELHHPYGRSGDNFFIFAPVTRTEHRLIHYGG